MKKQYLAEVVAAFLVLLAVAAPSVHGAPPPPEVSVPFEPRPLPPASYGIQAPDVDPDRQRHTLAASLDGTDLFVEVWLPVAKGGRVPPGRLPTILSFQPYTESGEINGNQVATVENLVSRGYAYAQAHVRGTHGSGGCWDRLGRVDQSDAADVVGFVADAPWSDGTIGLYGLSNPGAAALLAAGSANRAAAAPIKAVVAGAPEAAFYESFVGLGGVPYFEPTLSFYGSAQVVWSLDGQVSTPENRPTERPRCWPSTAADNASYDGSYTEFASDREVRRSAENIDVPVLMTQGFADPEVQSGTQVGLFDQFPAATRKVALYGLFAHEWPDGDDWYDLDAGQTDPMDQLVETDPAYTRADWQAMVVAWFDQHLKGVDSGADQWPSVQIQDTEGQWRAEEDWPATSGPRGRLALGPAGVLGASQPHGATSYVEGAYRNDHVPGGRPPGTSAQFVLPARGRLEIMGQPVLDLWVALDRPDAHVTVTLEAYDAAGEPIPYASTYGYRSAQHLDPYVGNRFEQRVPQLPPTGEPILVQVPLQPRDIVVPAGGKVVVSVAGSTPSFRAGLDAFGAPDGFHEPSQVSGTATRVTILHDCEHTSALRFQMPRDKRRLLNVREDRELGQPLPASIVPEKGSDGGGAATDAVCESPPAVRVLERDGTSSARRRS